MNYVFKISLVINFLFFLNNSNSQLLFKINKFGTPGFINNKGKEMTFPKCQSVADYHESLSRFKNVYAAAGHPYSIFKITYEQLIKITNGKEEDIV